MMDVKERLNYFLAQGILPTPEMLREEIPAAAVPAISGEISSSELISTLSESNSELNSEVSVLASPKVFPSFSVIKSFSSTAKKYTPADFTRCFVARYYQMEKYLRGRPEMQSVLSINKIIAKKERDKVSLIGMVYEKTVTKTGHLILTMEDPTGKVAVHISKDKRELIQQAQNLILDDVVGMTGVFNQKAIYGDNIIWPDIPFNTELKKADEEGRAIFLSDVHIGSKYFLSDEFNKFLSWLRGELGNEVQKELAAQIKYVFIVGDLVDGVGVYPEQDKELILKDINEQYREAARLLNLIPSQIKIFIIPGNHDCVHLFEPQPPIYEDYAKPLYEMPNVVMLSNPAVVSVGQTENFSGIQILLYHGYSFDHYVSEVDSIRNNGGYSRIDLTMKFLLKRRHLAPTFASNQLSPAFNFDPLVIDTVPDIFATGHIHYSLAANFKNVTLISGSCWQSSTPFQEKMGHKPEPARVPVINLKTREIKILKFID